MNYPHRSSGCGHAQGLVQCLTSSAPSGTDNKSTASGISIDTLIANELNPQGVEPLTLYSGLKGGYINEKLSFSAPGQVRAAEGNPWNVYQRLIGLADPNGGGGTGGTANQLVLQRKSVNDLVRAEMQHLLSRTDLSVADRQRLDQHFQSIRDMENTMTGMGLQCSADGLNVQALQAMNTGSAFRTDGNQEEVAKLQMELVAFAFSCNATRVATLQVGDGTDGTRYTINGQKVERFHWISHRIQSDGSSGAAIPQAVEWHTAIDRMRMETFKHLLTKWSDLPDGGWPAPRSRVRDVDEPRRDGARPQLQQPAHHHRRQRGRLPQAGSVHQRRQRRQQQALQHPGHGSGCARSERRRHGLRRLGPRGRRHQRTGRWMILVASRGTRLHRT